jgi:transposase
MLMKLTDAQWREIEPFIPKAEVAEKTNGRRWISARSVLDGILWVLKTGARWKDLPKDYPSYQTCHRRFQKWAESGVFHGIIQALVRDLEQRGKIDLTETYIDATYVDAQKGGGVSVKPNVVTGPRSWQSQIVGLFLSPLALRVLHDMRVNSLKERFGPAIQLTYLRELWVTKHTILIHLMSGFEIETESNSLFPISAIGSVKELRMDELYADINDDGKSNDFLPGSLLLDASRSGTTIKTLTF